MPHPVLPRDLGIFSEKVPNLGLGQTLFGKDVANIRKELSAERVILDNSDQC